MASVTCLYLFTAYLLIYCLLTYLLLTYLFSAGVSRIPTLCRADDELDALSDTGTYDVDDDESVAVVEARRQIDKAFGVLSNVFSVTSVASNGPTETQVNRAVFAGNDIRPITGLYEDKHRYKIQDLRDVLGVKRPSAINGHNTDVEFYKRLHDKMQYIPAVQYLLRFRDSGAEYK